MKKQLYIILTLTLLILIFATVVSAADINILLNSPGTDAASSSTSQDFIFGFSQVPDMEECSLIVDGEVKKTRNTLIMMNNNKLNIELESGSHEWMVKCIDTDNNELVSETRKLTINAGTATAGDYDIIYIASGLRTYAITLSEGKDAFDLPAMKGGEEMQFKLGSKKHYVDLIKMGTDDKGGFVEIRDRTHSKIYRLALDTSQAFDFNDDAILDVELMFKELERNVNVFFTVTPFPGTVVEPEPEVPVVEPEPEPIPVEPPIEEETPIVGGDEDEHGCIGSAGYTWCEEKQKCLREWEEPCEVAAVEPEPTKNKAWIPILIAIIVIALILIIIFSSKGKKKPKHVHTHKKEHKAEHKTEQHKPHHEAKEHHKEHKKRNLKKQQNPVKTGL